MAENAPEDDPLAAVRDSVLQLVERLPRLPSVLRVAAGDVTFEAEWSPDAGAAAAALADGGRDRNGDGESEGDPVPAGQSLVCSPTVGSFYRSPKPGDPPFVEVGDQVVPGQQVAVVESMKLLFPVESPGAGTVVEILKDDAAPVEHGEPLLILQTS